MVTSKAKFMWMNGKIIPWEDAKVHIRSNVARAGLNVFEGMRAYWSPEREELFIFRNEEHWQRLDRSMKVLRFAVPYTHEDWTRASIELFKANQFREDVHYIPEVYMDEGDPDALPGEIFFGASIAAVARPQPDELWTGISACVSSWTRISDNAVPPRVKAGANYYNARLAALEARLNGYQAAIFLTQQGKVSEGGGACLMMVRDGKLVIPSTSSDILESITRATMIELARNELGLEVIERTVDRTELYAADELFFCGSGWELMPITSVDKLPVGDGQRGHITRGLQDLYFNVVRGRVPKYEHWLTPVYGRVPAGAAR